MNRQDQIAAECGLFYEKLADEDLLIFALKNSNSQFLKSALRKSIFDPSILYDKKIIEDILNILE